MSLASLESDRRSYVNDALYWSGRAQDHSARVTALEADLNHVQGQLQSARDVAEACWNLISTARDADQDLSKLGDAVSAALVEDARAAVIALGSANVPNAEQAYAAAQALVGELEASASLINGSLTDARLSYADAARRASTARQQADRVSYQIARYNG
ncbi:MAG: hypothetical protein E7001_03205 [Coriobacteriaceae bacterium]|nr:hypothetical protein [Coriobacteriaceae bacterium]